jgi:hypothetical protein
MKQYESKMNNGNNQSNKCIEWQQSYQTHGSGATTNLSESLARSGAAQGMDGHVSASGA